MTRPWAIVTLLALTGALVWGCSHPTDHEIPPDLPYPLRSSPDSLMAQFVWAYENMDLDVYLDCLADSLVFYLNPEEVESNPELEPGYWRRAVEEEIHAAMFDTATGADRIDLTLTTTAIDTVPVPDERGRGVGWQYREAVDLRVYVGVTTYWATAPSMFEFRIDPDEAGPDGETLWEIVSWRDLPAGRENSSWGSVKAMYLRALTFEPRVSMRYGDPR